MDESNSVVVNLESHTEQRDETNRGLRLPSFYYSGFASAVAIFCLGLGSGAAGGLLLGMMAVTVLQSLELLADNKPLMDQLELLIKNNPFKDFKILSQSDDNVFNTYISILVEEFDMFSSVLSLAAGIFVGLSTYTFIIKEYGEAVMGKALALGGSVCLMVVTATGCVLGPALEGFLTITSSVRLWTLVFISCFVPWTLFIFAWIGDHSFHIAPFTVWILTPETLMTTFLVNMLLTTKLILMAALFPMILGVYLLGEIYNFKLHIASVALMLIITDVFNIAEQPIVTLQAPAPTNTSSAAPKNTSSAVLEGIFIGVLTAQMLTAAIGASLCVSWYRRGAGKICATAAGSGTTVFGVIKFLLPALGPGPTIGALTGVAGAVGVALAAAKEATDKYGQAVSHGVVGKVGVTVGAGVGAFLYSLTHSGLSRWFMALCAASIPAGLFLRPLFLFLWQKFQYCSCIIIIGVVCTWLCFTCNVLLVLMLIYLLSVFVCYYLQLSLFCCIFFACLNPRREVTQ
ncbi:hypothetical protein INR49_030555 [Caranx melampygus]|nr:hypothetical protein INR49_030555 [Caranx melampygus]